MRNDKEVVCRLLTVADVELFREIRLRGLKEHPDAFLDSYEESVDWPLERFKKWFGNGWIAGGFVDQKLLGITGLYRQDRIKIRHKGMVWGVYVAPEARGFGIARRLIEILLAEAKKAGLELVQLSTDVTNPITVALYQSFGFEPYGVEKHILKLQDRYVDDVVMVKFL